MSDASRKALHLLQPNPLETRLAEQFTTVLDLVSRCVQGVENANPQYLWEKSGSLMEASASLYRTLSRPGRPQRFQRPDVNPEVVHLLTQVFAQDHSAGRLLFPAEGIADETLRAAVDRDHRRRLRP